MTNASFRVEVPMRWGDQDAFAHINNVTMFRMLEEARVRAFFVTDEPGPATAILRAGIEEGTLTMIASHHIEYLAPVPYRRAPLLVDMWFGKLGGSSADLCYEVRTEDATSPVVKAASTMVMVDAASGKPRKLSDAERAVWEPFVGTPIEFRR